MSRRQSKFMAVVDSLWRHGVTKHHVTAWQCGVAVSGEVMRLNVAWRTSGRWCHANIVMSLQCSHDHLTVNLSKRSWRRLNAPSLHLCDMNVEATCRMHECVKSWPHEIGSAIVSCSNGVQRHKLVDLKFYLPRASLGLGQLGPCVPVEADRWHVSGAVQLLHALRE